MATHSSALAWRIPGVGELGGLPSLGSHRVGHDWSDIAAAAASFSGDIFCNYRTLSKPRNWLAPLIQLTTELIQISPFFFFACPQFLYVFVYVRACSVTQSCPTLCNSMDSSPPGSSVCEILQARVLEWVALSSSKGSSQPRDLTLVSCSSCTGRWILYRWTTSEAHLITCIDSQLKL